MPSPRRYAAAALALVALAGCAKDPATGAASDAPTPVPAPTTVLGVVDTGAGQQPLTLRNLASSSGTAIAQIPNRANITLECTVKGTTISGTQGSTPLWDRVTYEGKSGYVAAAYVQHGADPQLPTCGVKPQAAVSPLPVPSAGGELEARIVSIARSQLGVAERAGNCNPYGPCEEWCGDFASWVWQQAGAQVPRYAFTGDFAAWGTKNGRTHQGTDGVGPGDLVLYGSGPKTVKTSLHVDIVVEVLGDQLRVIGGNVDDAVAERVVPRTGIYAWVDAKQP